MASSDSGGSVPMAIEGRMARERERLFNMTDEERAWRKQWLKDQELAPNEPLPRSEAYYVERFNPIRRFYRFPLDKVYQALIPTVGESRAYNIRWVTGKIGVSILGIYLAAYYLKYGGHDWTRKGGWRIMKSKPRVVPGDCNYPYATCKVTDDYNDCGFKKSIFYGK